MSTAARPRPLSQRTFARALRELAASDAHLADAIEAYGRPPFWVREPGFATMIHMILEQQVSLASAQAAFDRLLELAKPLTPRRFLKLTDAQLRAAGFSRQKAGYGRDLANAVVSKTVDLEGVASMGDDDARTHLIAIRGIGRWTADCYLLMALRRPDVWPRGDIALHAGVGEMLGFDERPSDEEAAEIADAWAPWRAVAARVAWHAYLTRRGRS